MTPLPPFVKPRISCDSYYFLTRSDVNLVTPDASTTPPYNAQDGFVHYANYKVNGHNYGVVWKPAVAAMPLVTTLECN